MRSSQVETPERQLPCVVYACDQSYVEPMVASLNSVIDTWRGSLPAFTILDCGIEPKARSAILRIFGHLDLTVTPIDVTRLTHLPMLQHFGSPASFARLLMHEYLEPRYTHALYLDADTLAVSSLSGFQTMPLHGAPVAAVPEMYSPTVSNPHAFPHFEEFDLAPRQLYFNSGVLIVDLRLWRREGWGDRIVQFIDRHRHLLRYPDQDALNVVLGSRITPLDPSWNCGWMWDSIGFGGYEWYGDVAARALVRHFMGAEKPWHDDFPNAELSKLYWQSLTKSGFRDHLD